MAIFKKIGAYNMQDVDNAAKAIVQSFDVLHMIVTKG